MYQNVTHVHTHHYQTFTCDSLHKFYVYIPALVDDFYKKGDRNGIHSFANFSYLSRKIQVDDKTLTYVLI